MREWGTTMGKLKQGLKEKHWKTEKSTLGDNKIKKWSDNYEESEGGQHEREQKV